MPATIVFSSQKGGVGKTTSAVNLAVAFAIGGYRVLLIDLDPQGSVRYSFGIKDPVQKGTRELMSEPSIPLSELCVSSDGQGIDYIFSNIDTVKQERELAGKVRELDVVKQRLEGEAQDYDFVLLDSPSSTGLLALNALTAADLVILPLQCESLAIKSLKRFLVSFRELQKTHNPELRIAGILMTMYNRNLAVHRRICRQMYEALFESVFSTIVPQAKEISEASAVGQSVITYNVNSVGATAYIRLAKEILDRFGLRPELAAQ
jgi:chromosome partitioning protein